MGLLAALLFVCAAPCPSPQRGWFCADHPFPLVRRSVHCQPNLGCWVGCGGAGGGCVSVWHPCTCVGGLSQITCVACERRGSLGGGGSSSSDLRAPVEPVDTSVFADADSDAGEDDDYLAGMPDSFASERRGTHCHAASPVPSLPPLPTPGAFVPLAHDGVFGNCGTVPGQTAPDLCVGVCGDDVLWSHLCPLLPSALRGVPHPCRPCCPQGEGHRTL